MVSQLGPEFPAEATTTTPAALRFETVICINVQLSTLQPSSSEQYQLLLITSGDISGLGFKSFVSVGAINQSSASMYVCKEPLPLSISLVAIHFAPGAIPMVSVSP